MLLKERVKIKTDNVVDKADNGKRESNGDKL